MSSSVSTPRPGRLTRIGGILVFLGFLGFGAMFVAFGIQDANPLEIVGGGAWIVASVGVLLVTADLTRSPPR